MNNADPKAVNPRAVKMKNANPRAAKVKAADPRAVKVKIATPKAAKMKNVSPKTVNTQKEDQGFFQCLFLTNDIGFSPGLPFYLSKVFDLSDAI